MAINVAKLRQNGTFQPFGLYLTNFDEYQRHYCSNNKNMSVFVAQLEVIEHKIDTSDK